MPDKRQYLNKLFARYEHDSALNELRDNHPWAVTYRGAPNASVMLIGEAPGKNEQDTGCPFVGKSGDILNAVINDRFPYYITNVVKYQPPNNRDPSPAEKKASRPYLWAEILVVRPRIVVPLGSHATGLFHSHPSLRDLHGIASGFRLADHRFIVVPTWHPMATKYDTSLMSEFTNDIDFVSRLYMDRELLDAHDA